MNLIFKSPIEDIVKNRSSVRNYSEQVIPPETINEIKEYITTLENPFSVKVDFSFLSIKELPNTAKLGTYGIIKGATQYIGAKVKKNPLALEAVGYEFEKLILYLTSLGLGTCWLGGTFNKGEFAKALEVKEDDIFPAISPVGYASGKKSVQDNLVRFVAKSDKRKQWEEIFYNKEFSTPLKKAEGEQFSEVLELIRLAPSASNKQPWRVVKDGKNFHFYEKKTPKYSDRFEYDIQKLDVGIAACHFHLGILEKGYKGEFKRLEAPVLKVPEMTEYIFSWIGKK